jgi:hypothetical protein
MPTKNPRLTITLQPSLAAQLRRLSELTGNSQSAVISELLQGSGPVFDRLIAVLEAAKTAKASMRGKLVEDMERAQAQVEGALGMALDGFDQFTGSLLDEAEAVTRRARRGPATRGATGRGAAQPTPISNRGVRYDPIATKTIAKKRTRVSLEPLNSGVNSRGGKK